MTCIGEILEHCDCYDLGYACCHCDEVPLTPTPQRSKAKTLLVATAVVGVTLAVLATLHKL